MINTKAELKYYLECDRVALGKKEKTPAFWGDEVWKFQICMRKLQYYVNRGEPCSKSSIGISIIDYQ